MSSCKRQKSRVLIAIFLTGFVLFCAPDLHAAFVRGTVTDPLGAAVSGARVSLYANGKVVSSGVTRPDGTYSLTTADKGHFYVIAAGTSFRQIKTEGFYAGSLESVEQNIVLIPEWVRQEIVVTATGSPLPQAQVSGSTSVLPESSFANSADLVSVMRTMPGTNVVQAGERGAQTSLFVRGGTSDSNQVNFDGVPGEDIGGRFDFGNVASYGLDRAEVYRGPNSAAYGTDAAAAVVNLSTPRGATSSPSLFYAGDGGNFGTYRNEVQLGGTLSKIDYYAGFARFDTSNSIPMDKYHVATTTGNFGYAISSRTQLRGTVRYGVSATGVPNAYDFYRLSDDRKEGDQNLYSGATIDNQTTLDFHNMVRYALTRKREQSQQWYAAGIYIPETVVDAENFVYAGGNYYGNPVTITGANGYKVSGQALLNYSPQNYGVYPNRLDLVNNRDQLQYQGDYHFPKHITGLLGFRYENERGAEREPVYYINEQLERTNYDYTLQVQGDIKGRIFYSLGGGLVKNQLFGIETTPRIGASYYAVKPGRGAFHGTKIKFNFAKGVKEPTLSDQFGSLYAFLAAQPTGEQAIQRFGITPIGAERSRSYDGGVEQSLFSERVVFRVTYFHNEFGNQIESVGAEVVPELLPDLTPAEQAALKAYLKAAGAYSLDLNSLAYRAQGIESEVEYGIGRNIFLRGGYTYLDAKVQQSFSSDALNPTYNTGLFNGPAPSFSHIPIGVYSPLVGARPFRRPPHTGFGSASYNGRKFAVQFVAAFASKSDDSTFLGYSDIEQGNSLLLPNRNLDNGFAKLDLGGSYNLKTWMTVFAQAENLTDDQHIAPIGYPSLPFNIRAGVKLALGRGMFGK